MIALQARPERPRKRALNACLNKNYFVASRYQSKIRSPVQYNTPLNLDMYSYIDSRYLIRDGWPLDMDEWQWP